MKRVKLPLYVEVYSWLHNLRVRLWVMRLVYKICMRRGLTWLIAYADPIGLGFYYHGDEVIWLWPWNRNGKGRYLSVLSEARFDTLAEVANFWESYDAVCNAL